jgi:oligosaccharyl transferase (archaeosortase A-associated)
MSERFEEQEAPTLASVGEYLREEYQVPILALLMAFMLWVRTRSYDRFVRDGEVFFSGNDPYYHIREVSYTVRNWPATMPYDPWTYYPFGTNVDQFGTLFDQLVATAALVVGLGSPSQALVGKTLLVAPAVFGAATAVPAYLLGKRLGGRFGGLFGAVVLALLPGSFLQRTLVGAGDHHAAEVFFQAVAVLGILAALAVAERDKPVWELVVDRDVDALRAPLGWGVLGGVALGLYVWTWPPAVLLVGIFGAFLLVKMVAAYLNGGSPEPVAFAGATVLGTTGVMSLVPFSAATFSPTIYGLLTPMLSFGGAAGCVLLAYLAREWDAREYDVRSYPAAVGGLMLASLVVMAVALPDLFGTIQSNFQRFIGFSAGAETRTIREANPFLAQANPARGVSAVDVIVQQYGWMFFTALAALAYMIARPLLYSRDTRDQATLLGAAVFVAVVYQFGVGGALTGALSLGVDQVVLETLLVGLAVATVLVRGDHDAEEMFVAVWALFIVAAAFTQVRFNYYLAIVVVALNAYLLGRVMRALDVVDADGVVNTDVEPYQVMALMLALMVVLPGLVIPVTIAGGGQNAQTTQRADQIGNATGPSGITQWEGSLEWLSEETPREGQFDGADGDLDYYGTYARPADGDFTYPEGTYGVMSWWDYGHWITAEGERIPNANPFQEGATTAANVLLAPNESQADRILAEQAEEGEQTRYVMVDWQMVDTDSRSAKFGAPTQFYDAENVSYRDFVGEPIYRQTQQGGYSVVTQPRQQRYYESLMVRLYRFHGSSIERQPYVLDWRQASAGSATGETVSIRAAPQDGPVVKQFQTVEAAEAYVRNDSTSRLGGFGRVPSERVPALEHYRLVDASESQAFSSGAYYRSTLRQLRSLNVSQNLLFQHPSWVKTFERVEGARVTGQGPPNTTVTAAVQMRIPETNRTFRYTQRAETGPDGQFEVTLPYSTTGYDEYGPEQNGHTNVSVRATGPYVFRTAIQQNESALYNFQTTANVTEAQVLGDAEGSSVELERNVFGEFNTSTGNESTGNESTGNESVTTLGGSASGDGAIAGTESPAPDGDAAGGPAVPPEPGTDADAPVEPSGADDGAPAAPATRAGVFGLLAAGLVVETRD